MRVRNIQKIIRLNRSEAQDLQKKAKKACVSEAGLIRLLLKGYEPREKPDEKFYDAMRELSAIGNNINQLSVKANTLGFVDAPLKDLNSALLTRLPLLPKRRKLSSSVRRRNRTSRPRARAKSLRRKQSGNLFRKKWAATKTPQSPRQTKTLCQGKTQNRQICKLIRVSQSPPRRSLRSKKNSTDMLPRRNREKKQSEPCRRPRNLNLKRKRLKPFISNPNPNRRNRKRGNHNDKQFYAEKSF